MILLFTLVTAKLGKRVKVRERVWREGNKQKKDEEKGREKERDR